MKKIFLGLFQIIVYILVYEIVIWSIYFIVGLLMSLLTAVPFLKILFTDLVMQGITYTLAPLISGIAIVTIMWFLFKKTGIHIVSSIIMIMILSYVNISNIISAGMSYGIISWGFADIVWQSVILCSIIIIGLLKLSGINIVKSNRI